MSWWLIQGCILPLSRVAETGSNSLPATPQGNQRTRKQTDKMTQNLSWHDVSLRFYKSGAWQIKLHSVSQWLRTNKHRTFVATGRIKRAKKCYLMICQPCGMYRLQETLNIQILLQQFSTLHTLFINGTEGRWNGFLFPFFRIFLLE